MFGVVASAISLYSGSVNSVTHAMKFKPGILKMVSFKT